jgi:hypothetical protein
MKPTLISDVGWCKAMKDAFAQRGLDVDALLAEAGVDLDTAEEVDLAGTAVSAPPRSPSRSASPTRATSIAPASAGSADRRA